MLTLEEANEHVLYGLLTRIGIESNGALMFV